MSSTPQAAADATGGPTSHTQNQGPRTTETPGTGRSTA